MQGRVREVRCSLVVKAGIKRLQCVEGLILPNLTLVMEGMTQLRCKSKPGSTRWTTTRAEEERRVSGRQIWAGSDCI